MKTSKPYAGRVASLGTKHGKERALERPFRLALGLKVMVPADLDTDLLGTFSGEVSRTGTALEVCERKARLAMAAAGLPLGIANEGSFGPHPYLPFVPAGLEVMTFIDDDRRLVVTESIFANRTNYDRREADDVGEIEEWLHTVHFPSHALIVKPKSGGRIQGITKGIVTRDALAKAIRLAAVNSTDGAALVETDMRAHLNPTRMASIRKLAFRLVRRLATPCVSCSAPGWGQTGVIKGLPCEECETPTLQALSLVFSCSACGHREEKRRDEPTASARFCPYCNP
jgi:hypothetical protein